ncbi:hypothetical protein Acr_11g0009810 [Actinidia rufa]|uniref:Protein FLX-like 1 n=1 Tax=Actinidia rufa TaxID=165716 RepID=A0A7J0FDC6_9ERIC|nr:hypothetical protein Acr_11g0009810 [Actinidia rufa]
MSGRNRGPPLPMKGVPHGGLPPIHEPHFGRGLGPMPHHALLEEMRETQFGMGPRELPTHPAIIKEQLAAQHQEIQGLLGDNQRLAATHVALKQELEAAQHELRQTAHYAGSLHAEKDMQMRELYEKAVKMEMDLGGVKAMRDELQQVHADIKELTASKQEVTSQVQAMTQDLARITADVQQAPALSCRNLAKWWRISLRTANRRFFLGSSSETRPDLVGNSPRSRLAGASIGHGWCDGGELPLNMRKRDMRRTMSMVKCWRINWFQWLGSWKKLRAEMANAEKRARAAAAVGNQGAGYGGNHPEAGYARNHYPANYGMNSMNPVQAGAENYSQYGPGPGSWGAYDMQRAQGPR